jgi:hypothetical protein
MRVYGGMGGKEAGPPDGFDRPQPRQGGVDGPGATTGAIERAF